MVFCRCSIMPFCTLGAVIAAIARAAEGCIWYSFATRACGTFRPAFLLASKGPPRNLRPQGHRRGQRIAASYRFHPLVQFARTSGNTFRCALPRHKTFSTLNIILNCATAVPSCLHVPTSHQSRMLAGIPAGFKT